MRIYTEVKGGEICRETWIHTISLFKDEDCEFCLFSESWWLWITDSAIRIAFYKIISWMCREYSACWSQLWTSLSLVGESRYYIRGRGYMIRRTCYEYDLWHFPWCHADCASSILAEIHRCHLQSTRDPVVHSMSFPEQTRECLGKPTLGLLNKMKLLAFRCRDFNLLWVRKGGGDCTSTLYVSCKLAISFMLRLDCAKLNNLSSIWTLDSRSVRAVVFTDEFNSNQAFPRSSKN